MTARNDPPARPLDAAKRPLTPLAGPYGHPFHPIAVTLPLGAWLGSFVFDLVGLVSGDVSAWATASRILIAIGLVGAIAAIVLGMHDYIMIPARSRASSVATYHMGLNMLVCGAYGVQFFYRNSVDTIPVFLVVVSALSLVILAISGWLGGKLAYRWGVRVADEKTQALAFRRDDESIPPAPISGPRASGGGAVRRSARTR